MVQRTSAGPTTTTKANPHAWERRLDRHSGQTWAPESLQARTLKGPA